MNQRRRRSVSQSLLPSIWVKAVCGPRHVFRELPEIDLAEPSKRPPFHPRQRITGLVTVRIKIGKRQDYPQPTYPAVEEQQTLSEFDV